jgi:transposase
MILAHKIALDPNNVQRTYFAKACGVARLAYNFGLAEWKEQYEAGGKPCERELRRLFNSRKDEVWPFVRDVTKCAPQLALMNLGTAFKNFFAGTASYPCFKKKGKSRDSYGQCRPQCRHQLGGKGIRKYASSVGKASTSVGVLVQAQSRLL